MLGVDKIGKMRRARFRERRSITGVIRDLAVSRTTVRNVLRSDAAAFSYDRRTAAT